MNYNCFDLSKPRDILVIGRSGVDLYPDQFGFTNQVISYSKYIGGSPANTAVQLAKMGIDVSFQSKVSQDNLGQYVRYYLKSQKVDVEYLTDVDDPNVRHSLAVAEQPERGVINYFFYRGNDIADFKLNVNEISEIYISQFKALLFSGTSLCASPSREAVLLAVEYAHKNGVKVIFDPDFRRSAWSNIDEAGVYYWIAAKNADIIFGTRTELDVVDRVYLPDNHDDEKSAKTLLRYTPELVCIKHGAKGSNVYLKDGTRVHGDIYPAHIYKENGAGDSFAGAFLARLLKNGSIEEALKYGAAAAALTISGKSCSASMPTARTVEDYIQYADSGKAEYWPGWNDIEKNNQ